MQPKMESEGDEEESKRSKPTNPSLPQELITAILVRLPVKYLLQYKSVSKPWLSLISSPEFVKSHLSVSAKHYTYHRVLLRKHKYPPLDDNLKQCSVSSLFNESITQAFDLDYPMKSTHRSLCILGSVNGLICLRILYEGLVLWNPSTRKFKQLSDPMMPAPMYLSIGFGYDEVHDDYKIVCVFFYNREDHNAKIYSLKHDSWRSLDDFPVRALNPGSGSTKFVNGKLLWVTSLWSIIYIDLVDEKCGEVEQPCYGEGQFTLKLGVLGSDLYVLCSYYCERGYRITHADVWVMEEYGIKKSWTKLYTIKYPNHLDVEPTPVCMSNKGEVLLLFESNLMVYNPEVKSLRYPEITDVDDCLEAEVYIESLVCPILQTNQ